MKACILVLAATFSTAQAVSFVDCCCGVLCPEKNRCSGWGDPATCTNGKPTSDPKDCESGSSSGNGESGSSKACQHLEPDREGATVVATGLSGHASGMALESPDPFAIRNATLSSPEADILSVSPLETKVPLYLRYLTLRL